MKPYLLSISAGLLIGIIYSLLGVRSPAPPIIALLGLLGILVGEQVPPLVRSWFAPSSQAAEIKMSCVEHVFGQMPTNETGDRGRNG